MTCFMDSIETITHNIPQKVIEDAGKSNLSKNEIFNIIYKVNKLNESQHAIDYTYIKDILLKDGKNNTRYEYLATSLANEIENNKQIKITVGLIIEIITSSIRDYIKNIENSESTNNNPIEIVVGEEIDSEKTIKKIVTAYVLGMDILKYSGITPQNDKNIYDVDINIKDEPEEINKIL